MSPNSRPMVGPYVLERPLGYGGMAEVWLGRHCDLDSLAAVKRLRPDMGVAIRERFHLEQRIVVRLSHPNIVPVFDLGEAYIAFAYIAGTDLRHRIRAPIEVAEAIEIVCAIGSALAGAHEKRVVHCDVKPANILLDERGTPFLTDFGVSRVLADDTEGHDETVAGTRGFMAPEQFEGLVVPASDQYSLARTLLAVLLPDGLSPLASVAIERLPPTVRTALEAPLTRALSDSPSARYPDIAEFVDALRGAEISGLRTATRPPQQRRDAAPYAWMRKPDKLNYIGASIARSSYRLSELESSGVFDSTAVARFKHASGYADIGWDVYGHEGRLGPIHDPIALARASDIIVLLHGLWTDRNLWKEMATGVVRDNGTAIVLVPDLMGFGLSRLSDEGAFKACSPRGVALAVREWLALLGLHTTPTVIVGHSYSATALLCARDTELGLAAHRICITPVLMFDNFKAQFSTLSMGLVGLLSACLPDSARRALAVSLFRHDKTLAKINLEARLAMAEAAHRIGGRKVAQLFWAIARARPAPATQLTHCTVVTTPDDPLVTQADAARSIAACGVPDMQHFKLAYGGHFPQFMDEQRPEWGARNIHELVNLIDSITNMPRNLSGHRTFDRPAAMTEDPTTDIG